MKLNLKQLSFSLLFLVFAMPMFIFAGGHDANENHDKKSHHVVGPINSQEGIAEYMQHHLQDSHDFTFFTDGTNGIHYGFPLPVILIDGGLHVFMSSKFHHGAEVAESKGNYYKLDHGKIYKTDQSGNLQYDEHGHATNAKPIDLSITKNIVGILLTMTLMLVMFIKLAKSYRKNAVPKGFLRLLEPLVLYVRDDIAGPNLGHKTRKFLPYLLTIFFYIWIMNLLGMTPLGFNVTGNLAVTVALTVFTFVIVQFSANFDYWKHIFWMPGVPIPMKIILMPIEILGIFTKPFSLLIRLFANMTAGHMVIMSLVALVILMKSQFGAVGSISLSFALSSFIFLIEFLVAFLQAFIFTMLSAVFIGLAVQDHHEEH
jgi:F-type H+-transporting ATPase subunit a